jgi:hypothetical protein
MFKTKGPLDNTTYTKYLRQRANTNMFISDTTNGIAQGERMSIISRPPIGDILTTGLLRQINRPIINYNTIVNVGDFNLVSGEFILENLNIVSPSNIVNFSFIGGTGYEVVFAILITPDSIISATIDGVVVNVDNSVLPGSSVLSFNAGTLTQSSVLRVVFSTTVSTLTQFGLTPP